MQKQCHDPCGHCCNQNNDQRIHQSLGSRAHIQLGKVNSACDKRKSRNNKQHGTNVSRLMLNGNTEQYLTDLQKSGIDQTGHRDRRNDAEKQSKMMLCQFTSQEIPDPGSCKSAEHLNRTATQQERKSTACKRRRKSKYDR